MKSLRIYIIIISAVLAVYLIAQLNRPRQIDWSETYISTDKIPFGTSILYNRLDDIFPDAAVQVFREPIYNVINDHDITNATYLIVCKEAGINEYDFDKLKKFIEVGNDVFISAEGFGSEFEKKLKLEIAYELVGQGSVGSKILSGKVDSEKVYSTGRGDGLLYFDRFNVDSAVVIGTNYYHHVNFLRYSFGKGRLFLNTNPIMFSNYSLLNEQGGVYASMALSFVRNSKNLVWDQYYSAGREGDESEMRVFLRNAALRWAFYIAFAGLVVFVIYEIKRRQRIIPVIEPLDNATLSFVTTVGQVYFEQHDNANIAGKKILYFLEHLRVEYYLKTNPLDEEFIESFSRKTGIDAGFARDLVNYINFVNAQSTLSSSELIHLNKLIEQFYNKSR